MALPAIQSDPGETALAVVVPQRQRDQMVDVADVWLIIWRRRRWIVAATAALLACVLVYCLLTPALYYASGQILLDPRDRTVVANDVNPAALSPDGGVTQVESQSKVLQSSSVLLRAINKLDLTNDPEFGARAGELSLMLDSLRERLGIPAPQRDDVDRRSKTLLKLRRQLAIKRADKVFVVDVGLTAKDPDRAAEIVNAILAAYLDDQAEAKADGALKASDALAGRLDQQRQRVRDAANAVETYKAKNGIIEANNLLVTDQTLASLTAELTSASSKTALLRTRLALSQNRGGTASDDDSTAEAMKSSTISQLRNQEALLVQNASELRREFGPRYPAVRKVDTQLADLRSLIERELERVRRASQNDYDRAVAYEKSLVTAVDQLKREKVTSDEKTVQLRELERELEAARTVYASYLLRTQETREQAGIDSTNARVISWSTPPQEKSWPLTGVLFVATLGAGLGLGAGGALASEYLAPTIISRAQMRRVCDAPDVGIVPMAEKSKSVFRFFRSRTRRKQHHTSEMAINRALLALRQSGNASLEGTPVGRIIVVTSGPGENDDRTTVVRLLVAAALMQGQKVLFVDADPAGYQKLQPPGLMDVLRGESSLSSVLVREPVTGVAMMGRGNDRASRGGTSAIAAVRVLAEACRRFDLVIVDGCVIADDMRMLSVVPAADEIVYVARLGRTSKEDVTTAMDVLATIGRKISATLLLKPLNVG